MKIAIATTNFPRWKDDFRVPFIIDAAKAIQRIKMMSEKYVIGVNAIARSQPALRTSGHLWRIQIWIGFTSAKV